MTLATIKRVHELPGGAAAAGAEVLLSGELWQIVLEYLEQDVDRDAAFGGPGVNGASSKRIAVCLQLSSDSSISTRTRQGAVSSLVCWAAKDDSPQDQRGLQVCVPSSLSTRHPEVIRKGIEQLSVQPTQPILLDSLILSALDDASYRSASTHQAEVIQHLCHTSAIRRTGEVLLLSEELKLPNGTHAINNGSVNGAHDQALPSRLKVVMTEPVMQGYCREDHTQIIVTPPTNKQVPEDATEQSFPKVVDLNIDEDFLAAALMGDLDGPLEDTAPTEEGVAQQPNGHLQPDAVASSDHRRTAKVVVHSTIPARHLLSPNPPQSEDGTIQVLVKTQDLGRLGLFGGDFASITSTTTQDRRIVKLYAFDDPDGKDSRQPSLSLSPLLAFNMGSPETVIIEPIEGLPESGHAYPLAGAISIARVASEYSMHKRYQPLFLAALKAYFQEAVRVFKEGDLIAIPMDERMVRYLGEGNEQDADADEDDTEPFELPDMAVQKNAIAYFKVSELRPERTDKVASKGQSPQLRVDPTITTMVQTGLANCKVPSQSLVSSAVVPRRTDETGKQTVFGRLEEYITAALRPDSSRFGINLTVLLKGAKGSGKVTTIRAAAQAVGFHVFDLDCFSLIGETDVKTEGNLAAKFDRAADSTPSILVLRHIEALARKSQSIETGQEPTISAVLQDCLKVAKEAWRRSGFPLIVVGTTDDVDKIPVSVLGFFKEELAIEAPAEAERLSMLQDMLAADCLAADVSIKSLAVQTAALVAGDLVDLCNRARVTATQRLVKQGLPLDACRSAGVALTAADFTTALDQARSSYSESIGAPKIPNVTWDDVGGLAKVKTEILDTIQLPLEHPELFADGLKKRSGVLLYGPPGTGKTLLAKAVATSCSLNFFSVKGPELLNMYIGESEANVRRVFQRARDAKPCVIFFDELDSVAPKRGNQGDSGGVMDRIVSQLLAELDGMAEGSGGADVFVIGATNRPDLLDPALLRPGRFDRMLYLGVSDTHDAQLKIIEALTRKFKLDPNIDLRAVAELCPFNYTGADFYALCSDAMLKAMSRKAEQVDRRIAELNETPKYRNNHLTPQYYLAELAAPEEIEVLVSQRDFELALSELVPSVSAAEMEHYRLVQQRFSGNQSQPNGEATKEEQIGNMVKDKKGKGKGKGKARAL